MGRLLSLSMMLAVALGAVLALAPRARANEQAADAEAEMARADIYMRGGNFVAAIAHYNAARVLAPERPGPYRGLGLAYYANGQCTEALPVLEEYLRLKPQDPLPAAVRALADCKAQRAGVAPLGAPGTFRVTSEPPGAEVRLDDERGELLGYTPFASESIPAGPHRVYLSKPNFQPAVGEVRVQSNVQASLHVGLVPLSLSAGERRRLERETAEQQREVESYAAGQQRQQTFDQELFARLEREKLSVVAAGDTYTIRDVNGPITENAFVRRYQKMTGSKDLDFALKMRNKAVMGVWASFGLAGVALLGYGAATLHDCAGDSDPSCSKGVNTLSETLLLAGLGVQVGSSLVFLFYGGLRPDGVATQHLLAEYDARQAVDRYNRAVERRLRSGVLPVERPTSFLPAQPKPARPRVLLSPYITPYIGPSGVGVVGVF